MHSPLLRFFWSASSISLQGRWHSEVPENLSPEAGLKHKRHNVPRIRAFREFLENLRQSMRFSKRKEWIPDFNLDFWADGECFVFSVPFWRKKCETVAHNPSCTFFTKRNVFIDDFKTLNKSYNLCRNSLDFFFPSFQSEFSHVSIIYSIIIIKSELWFPSTYTWTAHLTSASP